MDFSEAKDILNRYSGKQYAKGDNVGRDNMKGAWDFVSQRVLSLLPEGMAYCRKNNWQMSGHFARYYWMRTTAEGRQGDLKKEGDGYSHAPISLSFFIEKGDDASYNFRVCLEIEHDGANTEFLRKYYGFFELDDAAKDGLSLFNENSENYLAAEVLNDYQLVERMVDEKLNNNEQTFFSIGLSFPVEKDDERNGRNIRNAFSKVKAVYDFVIGLDSGSLGLDAPDSHKNQTPEVKSKKLPKNIILFGAPGTGKTYATSNYAVAICRGDCDVERTKSEERKEINGEFEALKKGGRIDFITFHQSYSYEDFVVGLFPKLNASGGLSYEIKPGAFLKICRKARNDKSHNYVMVIDEINRGNISKIFGELITLIEESRREGGSESSSALLPYSTDPDGSPEYLTVPSNLYIIGTMNTADRSIQHIDTALRRRFTFVEMKPDASIFKSLIVRQGSKSVHMGVLLTKLNERIEAYFDREHVIGQAYFTDLLKEMSEEERFAMLGEIFANKILPLLQDYFFDDYKKICYVLNEDPGESDPYDFVQSLEDSSGYDDQFHARYKVHDLYEEDSPFRKIEGYIKITKDPADLSDE